MTKSVHLFLAAIFLLFPTAALAAAGQDAEPGFITEMKKFPALEAEKGLTSIGQKLMFRASEQPFLLVATIIFLLAIIHTFFAIPITKYSHKVQHDHDAEIRRLKAAKGESAVAQDMVSFKATVLHFLGEVEAIFGIWVLVLIGAMAAFKGTGAVTGYFMGVNCTEPIFVVIIMALASTRMRHGVAVRRHAQYPEHRQVPDAA